MSLLIVSKAAAYVVDHTEQLPVKSYYVCDHALVLPITVRAPVDVLAEFYCTAPNQGIYNFRTATTKNRLLFLKSYGRGRNAGGPTLRKCAMLCRHRPLVQYGCDA